MSEPWTKPSNAKQASHLTHEKASEFQHTAFPNISLCITTHIKIQSMQSPFQKGTQVVSTFLFPKKRQMLITGRSSL